MRASVRLQETLAKLLLWGSVAMVGFALAAILWHILSNGLSVIDWTFLTDRIRGGGESGGIGPAIIGTAYLVLLSLLLSVPLGVATAIYLTEFVRRGRLVNLIRLATETLAGIPSIIYGLFGFIFFVIKLRLGWSLLSGSLTLCIMLLPTIVRTSEEAIKAVPQSYREGSLSLGATRWQTIRRIVLPAALPGILTGIILSIGRVVGESAAVILTAGSPVTVPRGVLAPTRSPAVHLFIIATEGSSLQRSYGTATVLVIAILLVNTLTNYLIKRMVVRHA